MIIYETTKENFIQDTDVANKLKKEFENKHIRCNDNEITSWENSLKAMQDLLKQSNIADDVAIYLEYQIPLMSKRADFVIAGSDGNGQNHVIIIELKQWESCERTGSNGVVKAFTGGRSQEVTHPSYQAQSYAGWLCAFCKAIEDENIGVHSCSYLHNMKEDGELRCDAYKGILEDSPAFIKGEEKDLIEYLEKYVKKQETIDIFYAIEHSELKPNKALQDAAATMIQNRQIFSLIDEQKVVYETVLESVKKSIESNKKTMIICKGGPGTGKSVVALKIIFALISGKNKATCCYVTKNEAPRLVFRQNLANRDLDPLFKGPGSFQKRFGTRENQYDCIVVDEAHRLAERGFTEPAGEIHNLPGIIRAAKVTVFFIDEKQKVTSKDIGTIKRLHEEAKNFNVTVVEGEDFNLVSQFRCGGNDGFLEFIDNVLYGQNTTCEFPKKYEIKIFNSPTKMRQALNIKNEINNKARIVAGYCYNWVSKDDINKYDIDLEDDFHAQWNFRRSNYIWATDKNSFNEVGCIHTSQGLEFDYCGVIIGKDLRYENGKVITDQEKNAKTDKASGIRTCNEKLADQLIKNTYRTLLTRGQKGCYIYCEDKALAKHLLEMLGRNSFDDDKETDLTESQKEGLEKLRNGGNYFITGEGGTGKSYLVERFCNDVLGKKRVLKCAPTGLAAAYIGGETIHKCFGITTIPGIKTKEDEPRNGIVKRIARYDTVIIDEISMCRVDCFEYIMRTIDKANEKRREENKSEIQVILCGDFFQLPPVVAEKEADILEEIYGTREGFSFESEEWEKHKFEMINLKENVRQGKEDDGGFLRNLNNLRAGKDVENTLMYFNNNAVKIRDDINTSVELHATNKSVDKYNEEALDKLPGDPHIYKAEIEGNIPEREYPVAKELKLKVGAKVMILINDKNGHYQNGSIGTVTKCFDDGVIVSVNNRNEYIVPHTYDIPAEPEYKEGEILQNKIGKYTQIPLKLAYALTVHKSQGQTFEKINFDPQGKGSESLQNGQLYVALSRLKSIKGLYLYNNISKKELKTSQKVIDFYSRNTLNS